MHIQELMIRAAIRNIFFYDVLKHVANTNEETEIETEYGTVFVFTNYYGELNIVTDEQMCNCGCGYYRSKTIRVTAKKYA